MRIANAVSISARIAASAYSSERGTHMEKIYKLIGKRGRTTVPFEIRMKMRIGYNSLVSYEMKDENTVILRKEKILRSFNSGNPSDFKEKRSSGIFKAPSLSSD